MNTLEYEEEDYDDDVDGLFSDSESLFVDTRKPVATASEAGPSWARPTTKSASASPSPGPAKFNSYARLDELRAMRAHLAPPPARGAEALRNMAMSVIMANASRIWDVGGLEYPVIRELIDQLPRAQLTEIETNSEHMKPETDWLWEAFLIEEHPVYYEQHRLRDGQPRKKGWRKQYHRAVQDALERQEAAKERVAARYRELDEARNKKKVVVMEGLVAPKQKKSGWGGARAHSLSQARRGPHAAATYASAGNKALAKARAEANRERRALTQASGLIPSRSAVRTPRNAIQQQTSLYTNPEVEARRRPQVAMGPRLPKPRVPLPAERRADLPAHIKPQPEEKKGERFKLASPEKGKSKAPAVTSFFEPKNRVLNSISDMKALGSRQPERIKRPQPGCSESETKRQRVGSHEALGSPAETSRASPRGSPSLPASPSASRPDTPPRPLPVKPRRPQNLESVLFMKKKPAKRPSTVKR